MAVKKKVRRKRKIGALPVAFSGSVWGIGFKVVHQFDIYGSVNSIIEDKENGKEIANIDGNLKYVKDQADKFYRYILRNQKEPINPNEAGKNLDLLKKTIEKFTSNLSKEVREYNKGVKSKITVPKLTAPAKLPVKKKTATKKKAAPKKEKAIYKAPKKATQASEGWQYGSSNLAHDKRYQAKPPGKRFSDLTGKPYYERRANRSDKGQLLGIHKDTKSHNVNIKVVSGFFDTSIITTLDQLKKEYLKLAKKYHPDAGGTTVQFQDLQNEYEKLLKKLVNGSNLNEEQKKNEFELDEAIRKVIDSLVNIQNINIELIGQWLWISGDTYPVKEVFKSLKMFPVKKNDTFYWVYKGAESSGRGKMDMEQIKAKYGVTNLKAPQTKRISGFIKINKTSLKNNLRKVLKALNKRPV